MCPGWASNPHLLRDTILSRARIPIPPPGRGGVEGNRTPACWFCRPKRYHFATTPKHLYIIIIDKSLLFCDTQRDAPIAQLVEQIPLKDKVRGSRPRGRTGRVAKWQTRMV